MSGRPLSRPASILGLVLTLSATTSLESSVASAAPTVDEATTGALKKFETGRIDFEAGKFEEALLDFQGSYALAASPNARLYIARCYRALGKVASAYSSFRLAAREAQDRIAATGEKRYGATRDAASSEAAALESKVPRLTLATPSDTTPGFFLRKNGVEVPKELWGVAVETDPGSVQIEAGGPRLVPFTASVTLAEGQQERVDVKATRLPTASLALRLGARPSGMTVEVDGAAIDVGQAETPRELDIGPHELVVQAPGYVPFHWKKQLADADREVVEVRLVVDRSATTGAGPRGTPKWLFFAAVGVAAAGLTVASVVAFDAQSTKDTEIAKNPYQRSADTRDSVRSQATTANILFVAGGAVGVAAAVLAFTTQWKTTPSQSAAVAPWFGPHDGGIATYWTF